MALVDGSIAPDFTVSVGENSAFALKDHRGKKVILYFYPKDNTPGCTQEACDFKSSFRDLAQKNCVLIGISKDSLKSHANFSQKYRLPFPLGSDPKGEIAQTYGALTENNLYGRTYKGINRSTFLIDENGHIEKVWRSVKVNNHVQEILKCLIPKI
ncbi:MAG: hypothetical protein A2977_00060 [Alphaproteobacteria bacterium RIFCSPLOWO2_01_FULL_45_8]|nr:MAG: hypothetical protein A2065_03495 [Alphaproteobacteria bacterium GWB1_45_5]OFW76203.1 MAG: hypothetical protein A3K20_01565 [Alphaproteobacteria bacterium GWA1_45_9]OFW89528.1 MAG: hypothetical protein A2621_01220 [Alphaproteobacteria bacterium RIFCSPHIGHO2_01_FULL_41_14]OFW95643.1 MAG: hypothetical protein A2977_00060 [Alphaproteobacteria bacterium RIFCSPLOWO2_01_FULL_45_8]HCI48716.1 peroxiredoxin [Holosporales bacterium]